MISCIFVFVGDGFPVLPYMCKLNGTARKHGNPSPTVYLIGS